MEIRLPYRLIGEKLFGELLALLKSNTHVSLLGPRQGAKSLVLEEIQARAAAIPGTGRPKILRMTWKDFGDVSEDVFVAKTAEAMGLTMENTSRGQSRLAARLEDVFRLAVEQDFRPWWILIQDILGFTIPLARELLQTFHQCHLEPSLRSRMAVLVTGSADFVHLTYAETSPYRYAEKLIAVAMDRDYAARFFCTRRMRQRGETIPNTETGPLLENVNLDKEIDRDAFDLLYKETGGNAHLLQEIVVAACRHPYVGDINAMTIKWTTQQVRKAIDTYVDLWMPNEYFCRTTFREIAYSSESFDLLLKTLGRRKETPHVSRPEPCQLEVLGVAVRDEADNLSISCPVWRRFLDRFLDDRQEADVFALQQRWDEAWQAYSNLSASKKDRPVSASATFRLRMVMPAWERSLIDRIVQGPEAVWKQFALGAQYLMGFTSGGLFNDEAPWPTPLADRSIFGQVTPFRPDNSPRPHHVGPTGVRAWVDEERLCVYSDPVFALRFPPDTRPVLSLTREGFGHAIDSEAQKELWPILEVFWQAYKAAHDIEYQKVIGELEERFRAVVAQMHEHLFREPFDMGNVVRGAADALVETAGYLRTLICLVDPKRKRIQAVASNVRSGYADFPGPTDYALDGDGARIEDWDVQPWVVEKRHSCVIPDGGSSDQRDPRVNVEQGRQMGVQAFAVVPMKVGEEVFGTIHFERVDKLCPSETERQVFESLAGQLAVIFHQARRLALLQQSVHAITDKVTIADPKGSVLFVNTAACAHYPERDPGWQSNPIEVDSSRQIESDITRQLLIEEVEMEQSAVRHYQRGENSGCPSAAEILLAPLDDFRSRLAAPFTADGRIGYVEQIHDLTGLYDIVDALQDWLAAKGLKPTVRRIVDFFERSGFKWCRIYLLKRSETGTEWLESLDEFGLLIPDHQVKFRRGEIRFARSGATAGLWDAIEKTRELAVYEIKPGLSMGEVKEASSFHGWRRYYTGPIPHQEDLERVDAVWLQAPLTCGNRNIGLISLSMLPDYSPSRLEVLKVAVTGVAAAIDEAMRAEEAEERAIEETWKMASAQAVHQLLSKLNPAGDFQHYGLKSLLDNPELAVNYFRRAKASIEEARGILRQYQGYASDKPFPDAAAVTVGDLLNAAMSWIVKAHRDLSKVNVQIEPDVASLRVNVSRKAFEEIFEILVRNSEIHNDRSVNIWLSALRSGPPRRLSGTLQEFVCVSYQDSGKGIPPRDKEKIFEPFFGTNPRSTGLGLTIARRYMRRHQGEMLEEGIYENGACFNMYLPIYEEGKSL